LHAASSPIGSIAVIQSRKPPALGFADNNIHPAGGCRQNEALEAREREEPLVRYERRVTLMSDFRHNANGFWLLLVHPRQKEISLLGVLWIAQVTTQ
jgi:hypothetical protein